METKQLRCALALAEHQHFGRAARSLGMTQPPLSRQVASLEREVGVRLFDRTPAGVVPTAAGTAFLVHARRVLGELTAAGVDAQRAGRAETGRLRIGFDATALLRVLPSTLVLFAGSRPRVDLTLREMSSVDSGRALLRGEIDVAISRAAPRGAGAEDVESVPVERAHLVAVVASHHPLAGTPKAACSRLRGQPLIMTSAEEEPGMATAVQRALAEWVDTTTGVIAARDVHSIIGLAACGIGVGLIPSTARAALRPDTRWLDLDPAIDLPGLKVSSLRSDRSPVVSAFLDVACEQMTGG